MLQHTQDPTRNGLHVEDAYRDSDKGEGLPAPHDNTLLILKPKSGKGAWASKKEFQI